MVILIQGALYLAKGFLYHERNDNLTQLIDIEFVSQTDYQDKKSLLPATLPKPSLAKRTSPIVKSKGQLFTDPVFIVRAGGAPVQKERTFDEEERAPQKPENKQEQKQDVVQVMTWNKNDLASRYMPMSVPYSKVYTELASKAKNAKKAGKNNLNIDMEEVKPPELTEVKENDGDDSINHWQDGGSSTKGAGLTSSLAEYLKELHKKLKRAWTPPSGTVRHIKAIFRLDTAGSVISVRLTQSSGDKNADESALAAIKKASPYGDLPADYPHQFLDLAYTFNYTTDELSEIKDNNNVENQ